MEEKKNKNLQRVFYRTFTIIGQFCEKFQYKFQCGDIFFRHFYDCACETFYLLRRICNLPNSNKRFVHCERYQWIRTFFQVEFSNTSHHIGVNVARVHNILALFVFYFYFSLAYMYIYHKLRKSNGGRFFYYVICAFIFLDI